MTATPSGDRLGVAELLVTADLRGLQQGLREARTLIENFDNNINVNFNIPNLPVQQIANTANQLLEVANNANEAAQNIQRLRLNITGIPPANINGLSNQIRNFREQLRDLSSSSQDDQANFVAYGQRAAQLSAIRASRQGRTEVLSNYNAFRPENSDYFRGFLPENQQSSVLNQLPNTIAADVQRVRELRLEISNLERGTTQYNARLLDLERSQYAVSGATERVSAAFRALQVAQENAGARQADAGVSAQQLLDFANQVAQTPADIRAYTAALRTARDETLATDPTFARLTAEINRQRQALDGVNQAAERFASLQQQLQNSNQQRLLPPALGPDPNGVPRLTPEQEAEAARRASQLTRDEVRDRRRQERTQGIQDYYSGYNPNAGGVYGQSASGGSVLFAPGSNMMADRARFRQQQRQAELERFLNILSIAPQAAQRDTLEADLARTRERRLAQQAASARRGEQIGGAISSGLIGGVFPLLFGQGIGASVGGLAGGLGGGALGGGLGFGLSLVGTAIGAQFDAATNNAKLLGNALIDPIGKFRELADAGLLSSKALTLNTQALINAGREAEAAATIQRDLAFTYATTKGPEQLFTVNEQLTASWNKLGVAMTEFASGPLNLLLKALQGRINYEFQQLRTAEIKRGLRESGQGDKATQLGRQAFLPVVTKDGNSLEKLNDSFAKSLPAYKFANDALAQATRLRTQNLQLSLRQIAADAQGNKPLSANLQLEQLRTETRAKLATLANTGRLVDQKAFNDPQRPRVVLTADAQAAIDDERKKRQQILEQQRQYERQLAADNFASAIRISDIQRQAALEVKNINLSTFAQQRLQAQEQVNTARSAEAIARRNLAALPNDPQRQRALNEATTQRQAAETRASVQTTAANRAELAQRLSSERQIRDLRTQTAIQSLRPGLGSNGLQALQSLNELRQAQEGAREARRLAAESGGKNTTLNQQAAAANETLTLAAAKTKADLIEAYQAAKEAALAISRSTQDAKLNLLGLQGGSGGINAFLSGQGRYNRQQQAFGGLLPQFELAKQTALGFSNDPYYRESVSNVNFSGSYEAVNKQMMDFIGAVNNEQRQRQDLRMLEESGKLQKATADLAVITNAANKVGVDLTNSLGTTAKAIQNLADKRWDVNVVVNGVPQPQPIAIP